MGEKGGMMKTSYAVALAVTCLIVGVVVAALITYYVTKGQCDSDSDNICSNNPCKNGGSCETDFKCSCTNRWEGDTCEDEKYTEGLTCPGPEWHKLSTACYYPHNTTGISHKEAINFCKNKQPGAYLAEVETEREQQALAKLLLSIVMNPNVCAHCYWIGLSDEQTENKWIWNKTGLEATYQPWSPCQPDNWEDNEHCAELCEPFQYMFNDANCNKQDEHRFALCEYHP